MNIIKEKINGLINKFDNELASIKDCGEKYLQYCSIIDTDNSIKIGHNPVVAPNNYIVVLYEGVKKSWINKFKANTKIRIPKAYEKVLLNLNGCFVFGMVLYGLTPSLYNAKVFDMSMLQCLSLDRANTQWIREYGIGTDCFHFGGRSYSYNENVGYFITENTIEAKLKNGEIVKEYANIKEFLENEIKISEEMYLKEHTIEELC